jgi:hypothetical protein
MSFFQYVEEAPAFPYLFLIIRKLKLGKDKYHMTSLLCGIQKVSLLEFESKMVVTRGWGKEEGRRNEESLTSGD